MANPDLEFWKCGELAIEMRVLGRSRTGDLPLRRRLLYPLSYEDVLDIEGNLVMN